MTYLFPSVSAAVHNNVCALPEELDAGKISVPLQGRLCGTCRFGGGTSDSKWVGSLNMFSSRVMSDERCWRVLGKTDVLARAFNGFAQCLHT